MASSTTGGGSLRREHPRVDVPVTVLGTCGTTAVASAGGTVTASGPWQVDVSPVAHASGGDLCLRYGADHLDGRPGLLAARRRDALTGTDGSSAGTGPCAPTNSGDPTNPCAPTDGLVADADHLVRSCGTPVPGSARTRPAT